MRRRSIVGVNDQPGAAGTLFTELGKHNVNIDMIIQSNEEQNATNTITFTVSEDDYEEAKKVTEQVGRRLVHRESMAIPILLRFRLLVLE